MADVKERLPSNVIAPEDFLRHYRAIRDTKRAKEEAAAAHNAAKQAAKADGVDLNALKIVDHLSSLDDSEAELRMRDTLRYSAWLGLEIGTQTELFDDAPKEKLTDRIVGAHAEWTAEQKGYQAGKNAEPRDNNPYPGGSPLCERWDAGWHDGRGAPGAKPEAAE